MNNLHLLPLSCIKENAATSPVDVQPAVAEAVAVVSGPSFTAPNGRAEPGKLFPPPAVPMVRSTSRCMMFYERNGIVYGTAGAACQFANMIPIVCSQFCNEEMFTPVA